MNKRYDIIDLLYYMGWVPHPYWPPQPHCPHPSLFQKPRGLRNRHPRNWRIRHNFGRRGCGNKSQRPPLAGLDRTLKRDA